LEILIIIIVIVHDVRDSYRTGVLVATSSVHDDARRIYRTVSYIP